MSKESNEEHLWSQHTPVLTRWGVLEGHLLRRAELAVQSPWLLGRVIAELDQKSQAGRTPSALGVPWTNFPPTLRQTQTKRKRMRRGG